MTVDADETLITNSTETISFMLVCLPFASTGGREPGVCET
jgi:hypothetical protein